MIGSLRGVMLERVPSSGQSAEVLVEVAGVGYRVLVAASSLARLCAVGGAVFLHVHTHVREDAIVLYGFVSREERACFEALIGAHGVGPSVALALLSVHSPAALQRAVLSEDADALMMVPGIGRKTASRLLVELRSRLEAALDGLDLHLVGPAGGDAAAGGPAGPEGGSSPGDELQVRREVRAALAGLGYGSDEIRQVLAALPPGGKVEEQVRAALRELAAAR